MTTAPPADGGGDRLDRWLWQARFFRTRAIAARICREGRVRLDGNVVTRAAAVVHPGCVLTFVQGNRVRVVRILALASRRGPAAEARQLYDDLDQGGPPDA